MKRKTRTKPFPWRCPNCGQKTVEPTTLPYETSVKYEGKHYEIQIDDFHVPQCSNCRELILGNDSFEQIHVALRKHIGLLTPEEIRACREDLHLSQLQLAEQLSVANETISRWETGTVIQSRAMDKMLRVYFNVDEARLFLHPKTRLSSSTIQKKKPCGKTQPSEQKGTCHTNRPIRLCHNVAGQYRRLISPRKKSLRLQDSSAYKK